MLELLTSDLVEDDSADLWNLMRREVADVFDKNVFRKATALPQDILSVALCARGILDLKLPQDLEAQDTLRVLRSLPEVDSPIDLDSFHGEIDAIRMEFAAEEPEVVNAGSVTCTKKSDDVGLRADVLDSLASVLPEVRGESGVLPGSASSLPQSGEALPEAPDPLPEVPGRQQRKLTYPRVDPHEVEDQPGQAIR